MFSCSRYRLLLVTKIVVIFSCVALLLVSQGCKEAGRELRKVLHGAARDTGRSTQGKKAADDGERSVRHAQAQKNSIPQCPEGAVIKGAAYPEGDVQWCEAKGADGKPEKNGEFRRWHSKTGNLKLQAFYSHGVYEGKVRSWYPNGTIKEEEVYLNGLRTGPLVRWSKNGTKKMLATFKEGKMSGQYQSWNRDGKTKEKGYYQNDKKTGLWVHYNRSGAVGSEINYNDDKKDGQAKIYSRDGELSEIENYRAEVPHGKWISFYPTGVKRSEGLYVMGQKEGKWVDYNREGGQLKVTVFKNGTPVQELKPPVEHASAKRRGKTRFGKGDILGGHEPRVRRNFNESGPQPPQQQQEEEESGWKPL